MPDLSFEELVERARADERVVGLFLGGSRGKGANVRPGSDYDVRIVGDAEEYRTPRGTKLEVVVMSLEDLRNAPEWDRYTFTHVRAIIDKTGELQGILEAKGRLTAAESAERASLALDAYMNSLHRGLKRPHGIGGRLHAAEAAVHLLTCLFALEGRLRPFHDYLEWELANHPLPGWSGAELLRLIDGDPHELFRKVEAHVRGRGLGDVVDAWEPDVPRMRGEP